MFMSPNCNAHRPELFSKYLGEAEATVRLIFERAREMSPCILMFDEIDALAENRGSVAVMWCCISLCILTPVPWTESTDDSTGSTARILSQLLNEVWSHIS